MSGKSVTKESTTDTEGRLETTFIGNFEAQKLQGMETASAGTTGIRTKRYTLGKDQGARERTGMAVSSVQLKLSTCRARPLIYS